MEPPASTSYNPQARGIREMFADRTNWNLSPNRLSRVLEERRARGEPVLDLTTSNPTTCGFAYESEAILRALTNPGALTYSPDPKGLAIARRAVARYYSSLDPESTAESVILTTSTSEAYSWIFRTLCNPADSVLVPAPSYPLLGYLADVADVRLARYPLLYDHGWQIDLQSLKQAVTPKTRAVVVVHPNNPTGHYTKPQEVKRLSELCAACGMALIVDEVFLDFAIQDAGAREQALAKPASLAGNAAALTFTLSGLSKICGLPQMKAAWTVVSGPERLKAQAMERLEVIADTFLSPNAPVQLALPALLALRPGFQRQVLARLVQNLTELDRQLAGQKPCSRLKLEGGWYAVLRIPATRSDEDFAVELLKKHGVYVHPGHFFDFPSEGYLVVSLLTPEREFAEGIRLLLR